MTEIARNERGHFLRGQSGNPSGRPRIVAAVQEMAREHGPRALARVVELIDSDDERIALAASQEILNRAYGRPLQSVETKSTDFSAMFLEALISVNGAEKGEIIEHEAALGAIAPAYDQREELERTTIDHEDCEW
jgi:hypothetical protein